MTWTRLGVPNAIHNYLVPHDLKRSVKITLSQREEIKYLYWDKGCSQSFLARCYGVSDTAIYDVVHDRKHGFQGGQKGYCLKRLQEVKKHKAELFRKGLLISKEEK